MNRTKGLKRHKGRIREKSDDGGLEQRVQAEVTGSVLITDCEQERLGNQMQYMREKFETRITPRFLV